MKKLHLYNRTFGTWRVLWRHEVNRSRWVCECVACGAQTQQAPSVLRQDPPPRCRSCKRVPDAERKCQYCDASTDGRSGGSVRTCVACERRRIRNGIDPATGKPRYNGYDDALEKARAAQRRYRLGLEPRPGPRCTSTHAVHNRPRGRMADRLLRREGA